MAIVAIPAIFALQGALDNSYGDTLENDTGVCVGAGCDAITNDLPGTDLVNTVPSTVLLPQSITFSPPGSGTVGGSATLAATGGASGNPVTFSSSTTPTCTVSGSTVSFVGAGTCTIVANQAGNATYAAASPVSGSVIVSPGGSLPQSITISPPGSGTVGGSASLTATGGASGNPVTFSSSTSSKCTVSGSTVTYVGAGTCTIVANQAGNATYAAASPVSENVIVAKGSQTITFSPPGSGTVGGSATLTATGGASGNPVTFSSSTTARCTVSGSTVSFVGAGTCTIVANQAGDADYTAASPVSGNVTVAKGSQTITFPAFDVPNGGSTTLAATASSGLPVSYTSLDTGKCTVSGAVVSRSGNGKCTIRAAQLGNADWTAAPTVDVSDN